MKYASNKSKERKIRYVKQSKSLQKIPPHPIRHKWKVRFMHYTYDTIRYDKLKVSSTLRLLSSAFLSTSTATCLQYNSLLKFKSYFTEKKRRISFSFHKPTCKEIDSVSVEKADLLCKIDDCGPLSTRLLCRHPSKIILY